MNMRAWTAEAYEQACKSLVQNGGARSGVDVVRDTRAVERTARKNRLTSCSKWC